MCGIVGAVSTNDVLPVLMDGLRRLEYRGYDSSGVALINDGRLCRTRAVGKVRELDKALQAHPVSGFTGIAHTRWATHGVPSERNAHPHVSGNVALVCNGIIENHEELRRAQCERGFEFSSDTDTEVVVNQVATFMSEGLDLFDALRATVRMLEGAFALAVLSLDSPGRIAGARRGSPLVVGLGDGEAFLASDMSALVNVTRDFIVLDNGDIAEIDGSRVRITDENGVEVARPVRRSTLTPGAVELGDFRHYMQKEIFEQGQAVSDTLEGRISGSHLLEQVFGAEAGAVFDATRAVQIIACGTSYHAGLVARHWLERFGVPCSVEIASEFKSRAHVVPEDALVVTISQSGETIDTLSALHHAREIGFRHSLAICNVAESSLVRDSGLSLLTHAGPEIGVASTKAFTTQLTALMLLTIALGRRHRMSDAEETEIVHELRTLPARVEAALSMDEEIERLAEQFSDKQHALFLGRGMHYPIAMEGALKLKEISYIHAEAYAAGELKHGPLALVDADMPVIAVAPNNQLLEKLKSNIQEVRARGGRLLVFADQQAGIEQGDGVQVVDVAPVNDLISPIIYTIPLQLLSYHVALIKGTDVDKPRNLAKSVTVE
ncbi:MAG: glutamine--fructose-6-phosphate transaminase (isomerizing) [Proteobacteria bacterium]|nr:MAG: glutamine--fructose-6-phosphate transaminase (isomerizing) [Pseudomonadota bacterium]